MSSWPGIFQFSTFFSVDLSDSECILTPDLHKVLVILFPSYSSIPSFYYYCCFCLFSKPLSVLHTRILLSILADLNVVVCMVSICPLISYSSSPLSDPLGIESSTPFTIGITVTLIFHNSLSSPASSK